MSRTVQDAPLDVLEPSWIDDDMAPVSADLPILDLSSTEPLPQHLTQVPVAEQSGSLSRPEQPSSPAYVRTSSTGFWLDGDVLMCACPDCEAPMTVRLWLLVADCWRCGTSIQLTEEQQRAATRVLSRHEGERQAATQPTAPPPRSQPTDGRPRTAPAVSPDPPRRNRAVETALDSPRRARPSRPSPAPAPAAGRNPRTSIPRPLIAPPRAAAGRTRTVRPSDLHTTRVWTRDWLNDVPAWLISLILHLLMLTLLGLMTFDENRVNPTITLSTAVSREVREGDAEAWLTDDLVKFDLPIPASDRPKNQRQLRDILRADQDARRLRIDPRSPDPQLPELYRVKQAVTSTDVHRRMLAPRDPRLRVEMIKREGGTTLTEAAVARGLAWMAEHQNRDGSWSLTHFHRAGSCNRRCGGQGQIDGNAAATSLALLPYLGAGQTHLTGYYKNVVSAGLRWLLEHQKPDGDLRADSPSHIGMYVHGQAAIVLCEALGMTQDETFREPAQRAVRFIVDAQHPRGGWRYRPGQAGDTSVIGWQLMALESARSAGLQVPDEVLERAGHFLDSVQSLDGALYAYQARRAPTSTMTAEALLCRVYLGWRKDVPGLNEGVAYLLDQHLPDARRPDYYYWYYGTQLLHHVGGVEWQVWNRRMRDVLVSLQETTGHEAGSWAPRGGRAEAGGRLYTTSLAICSLEVYYRHAPIFRKITLD